VLLALLLVSCTPHHQRLATLPKHEGLYLPEPLNDPLEPINRGVWAFNQAVLEGAVFPVSKGYHLVVPTPARTSIRHFGYNLGYPGRALNQMLQGRVGDAGDESVRFVCNTTAGVLGLFDVASGWGIPKHRGNFGQTFRKWGWKGQTYVVLPLLGPSDEASVVGLGFDHLADPLSYQQETRYVLYGVRFNQITEDVDEALLLLHSDPDAYSLSRYIWPHIVNEDPPDWTLHEPPHAPSMETLAAATLRMRNPDFLNYLNKGEVKIPNTNRKLPFNYRLQKERAPLLYIVPGLGSHRLNKQALVLAEGLYDRGYSVVTITSPFHPEFIERASSSKVPGNAAADRKDLWIALAAMDDWFQRKHGDKLGARGMVGCSLGGFQALAMAAECGEVHLPPYRSGRKHTEPLRIDRFVAINPPVDLLYGLRQLDAYQEAPARWPEEVRQERINNTVHKSVALMMNPGAVPEGQAPFGEIESKYLIGIAFRLSLRNAIYTSERIHRLGNFQGRMSWWNRDEIYDEILGLSFSDYLHRVVLPHYAKQGVSEERFRANSDLKRLAPDLGRCRNADVITSRNDFLLSPGDVAWLRSTLGPQHLTLLDHGGHLGGLSNEAMLDLVAAKLAGLKQR